MSNNAEMPYETEPVSAIKQNETLKLYSKPTLQEMGDLRTLTLGVSNSPFPESGGAGMEYAYIGDP